MRAIDQRRAEVDTTKVLASFQYRIVNILAERPFEGNPLAVFPEAVAMPPELMQKFA